jgi:hypothetical protein
MLKAVFFAHAEDFENEYELRRWLDIDLRKYREGRYYLRKGSGLGLLEAGSIVFFHKNRYVVGWAVVKEDRRELKPEEVKRLVDAEKKGFESVIQFDPTSIWVWSHDKMLPVEIAEKIIGKEIKRGYSVVDDLSGVLAILQAAMRQ